MTSVQTTSFDQIANLLIHRDTLERDPFESIFQSNVDQLIQIAKLQNEIHAHVEEKEGLERDLESTKKELAVAQEIGNPQTIKKLTDLELQVRDLKEERGLLYKNQATNAQKILELMDTQKEMQGKVDTLNDQNIEYRKDRETLSKKLTDAIDLIKEKEGVIQILRDELATHQLELTQREEQLREKEAQCRELEGQVDDLVKQIVSIKEELAKQVNANNEMIEKKQAQQQKPVSASSLFAFFSKKNSDVKNEEEPIAELEPPILTTCSLPEQPVKRVTAIGDAEIHCLRIKSDGSLLATGGSDRKVVLYSTSSLMKRCVLSGPTQGIMSVAFNGTDTVMCSSNDQGIRLWSISSESPKATMTGHVGKVLSARFINDTSAVSGSHDRTIKLWDLNKGYCIKTIFTLSSCNDVIPLDTSGAVAASGHLDNNLRFWDTRTGNIIKEVTGLHFGQITGVEKASNSFQVLTTSRDNTLKLVDTRTFAPIMTFSDNDFQIPTNYCKSTISPDSRFIASGSSSGHLRVWDTMTGKMLTCLQAPHQSPIVSVVWHPMGGNTLFSVSEKERVLVEWGTQQLAM